MGTDHGTSAASWAFDGNTADHIYRAFLAGYDDGDPLIMDYYDPGSPLSGEWADGMTVGALAQRFGVDQWANDDAIDAIADAYELAFTDAYWAELQRVALYMTADVDDADAIAYWTAP